MPEVTSPPMVTLNAMQLIQEKVLFWKEGYAIVRNIFSADEMKILEAQILNSSWLKYQNAVLGTMNKNGGWGGGFASLNVTNECTGDDAFSLAGRSFRILDRSSFYYDDDVYCYHNKISAKPTGAKGFQPHQDFGGYWKNMGNDFPDPHAVFIAITPCDKTNGGVQVVPGSHLLGPLPHTPVAPESGLVEDTWREILAKGYVPVDVELAPGDGVFFHGNTIHLSGVNHSATTRIGYVVTLNTQRSSPRESENFCKHPTYTRMRRFYGTIDASHAAGPPNPFFGDKRS